MQNIISTASGTNFSAYTATVTGSGTVPVATLGATVGPDSTPGVTLSCTGTSGGIELLSGFLSVMQEDAFLLSLNAKASSASPTFTPFVATFYDVNSNVISAVTPLANAAAIAAFTQYTALVAVPDYAVKVQFAMANLIWTTTGGYSTIISSLMVLGF